MDKKRNRNYLFYILLMTPLFTFLLHPMSAAADELPNDQVVKILFKCRDVFEQNSIFSNFLRSLGWSVMKILAKIAASAKKLYDTCFGFADFTTYSKVNNYIDKFEKVWVALVCLSLLALGLILIFWQDKKPKFVVNVMLAVLVVTSSTFLLQKMNGLLSSEVRSELIGGSSASTAAYELIGSNMHDLLYLDSEVGIENLNKKNKDGIKNYKLTYETFNKQMFEMVDINETLDPDKYGDELESVLSKYLYTVPGGTLKDVQDTVGELVGIDNLSDWLGTDGDSMYFYLGDVYDGVAWTDLLNKFYYRYTVDWWAAYLEILSLIIVYVFMSYKVIRGIWEIAVGRLLAVLYSANLAGGKKILKILECIKDSYVVLILTTVFIKFYLFSCKFIGTMDVTGLTKGLILLFLAFAVIDGPNLVQKLTGIDAGMSDGMGKMMSMFYGTQMAGAVAGFGKNLAFGRDGHGGIFGTLTRSFSNLNTGGHSTIGNTPPGGTGETNAENGKHPPDQDENRNDQNRENQSSQMNSDRKDHSAASNSMSDEWDQNNNINQSEDVSEEAGRNQDRDFNHNESNITDSSGEDRIARDLNGKEEIEKHGEDSGNDIGNFDSGKSETLNGMDPASPENDSGFSSSIDMDRMDQALSGNSGSDSSYAADQNSNEEASVRPAGGQMFTPQQNGSKKKGLQQRLSRQVYFNPENLEGQRGKDI